MIFRSEGTLVQQNEKTYWFKNDVSGTQVPDRFAMSTVEGIVRRKLSTFEFNLLSRPLNASRSITIITIVSMLVSSQRNIIDHVVIGYLIRYRKNADGYLYGDVVGTEGFYDIDGKVVGNLRYTHKDEPGLPTPLLDPIDFVGGALADIVRAGGKAFLNSFRGAMVRVEQNLLARGATSKALDEFEQLTEEELSMVWGAGPTARPLTDNQVDRALELLRNGQDVHVESIGQMGQIQGNLDQLGVRSESSSTIIPQRPPVRNPKGELVDLPGSHLDGRGTFRVDPPHGPGKVPYHPHNEHPHINITLPNGKTLAVIVTGSKSF